MGLAELLDDGARLAPEYRGRLANHLPMALVALHRLGADDARLAAFAQRYARQLNPAPPAATWPAGDAWTARLGERAAWPSYRALFADWLASESAGGVLAQVLPALLPGCGAAAFHALIRTAYAVHARRAQELADALAYWASAYLSLDGSLPPDDARLIADDMLRAAADPGFDAALDAIIVDRGTLEALARDAARMYAASGDFTVLHLVTSAHALRVLLPFVENPLEAVADYTIAYTAARIAAAAEPGDIAAPLPWDALVAAALASDDEHVIKLVDSCREEERAYGGDDWQRAASRAVRPR